MSSSAGVDFAQPLTETSGIHTIVTNLQPQLPVLAHRAAVAGGGLLHHGRLHLRGAREGERDHGEEERHQDEARRHRAALGNHQEHGGKKIILMMNKIIFFSCGFWAIIK